MFIVLCGVLSPRLCPAIEPDFLMDSDPLLETTAPVDRFDPALKSLWLAALARPEIDMQRMAAETIARAHQSGMPELVAAVPALEKILQNAASHPAARYAAARALIVLESRNSGDKLFTASQSQGADLRQLIEPALATWDYRPARQIWIERLATPSTNYRDLILAFRGLATVREPAALPKLMSCVEDRTSHPGRRLEAAAAAGQIASTGLEPIAARLARDTRSSQFPNPLCAVRLLARHDSQPARQLLVELAGHAEQAVVLAALKRLREIDSNLVLPLAEAALHSRDPGVRLQAAAAFAKSPTIERIGSLGPLLADPHPEVRREICEHLLRLASMPELHEAICEAAQRVLAGDQRQREAALLLGELKYKPAAGRLVELLEAPQPDVMVAAAWALRKLAMPETIPALIDKSLKQTQRRRSENVPGLDEQVAHLLEALGLMNAQEAFPLLKEYVPKTFYEGDRSRGAAIWAIGRLKTGTLDEELADAFVERINDFADQQPETWLVKKQCAVGLARMKVVDTAPFLKGMAPRLASPAPLHAAVCWAVRELSGEELPPAKPAEIDRGDWFLEPLP